MSLLLKLQLQHKNKSWNTVNDVYLYHLSDDRRINLRIKYLDVLKTIAIIGVVVIHSAAPLVDNYSVGSYDWWTGNIYDSIFRTCVPLFFMVSGALLLNRDTISLKDFYLKKTLPLILAFVFWSTVYFIQRNIPYSESFTLNNYIKSMISGNIFGRLWFLYTIIGLYLVTPFIKTFVKNASEKELKAYLGLWFASTVGIGFLKHFYKLEVALDLSLVYGYVGYFILGYYFSKRNFKLNIKKSLLALAVLNIITIIGTYGLSIENSENNLYFYGNLSPNIILVTVLLFLVIKHSVNGQSSNLLKEISTNSLGIYLIHTFVMNYLRNVEVDEQLFNPVMGVPILVVLTFSVSLLISMLIRKIPVLRNVLP